MDELDMSQMYLLVGREPLPTDDTEEYARSFERVEDHRVAKDEVNGITISTVFLGLPLPPIGIQTLLMFNGQPALEQDYEEDAMLIFETWVSSEHGSFYARYRTWDEAEEGHREIVRRARAGQYEPTKYEDAEVDTF